MDSSVFIGIFSIVVGGGLGFFIRHIIANKNQYTEQRKAKEIIEQAKRSASDIKYKARQEVKAAAREERRQVEAEIRKRQNYIKSQEKKPSEKRGQLRTKDGGFRAES